MIKKIINSIITLFKNLLMIILNNKRNMLIAFIVLILIGAFREYGKSNEGFTNFKWNTNNNTSINKNTEERKLTKKEDFEDDKNPLEYFGFYNSKSENFNNTDDGFNSVLDEAENINTDDISSHGIRKMIKSYNDNLKKKLEKADNEDILVKSINQGKVLFTELKDLFNYELFF